MSMKTVGDDQEGSPAKKPRTSNTSNSEASPVSEDDEDSKSPFTVQELFHRIPPFVLEEIFDYLDAPQATRLGRLDFWKESVGKLRDSEASLAGPCGVIEYSIRWDMRLQVPFLQIHPHSTEVSAQQQLDSLKLIWPYPEEQLQWLMKSLSELDSKAVEAVKDTDWAWEMLKHRVYEKGRLTLPLTQSWVNDLDKLDLTTNATSNDRKLTSLDLAFLGRLLVGMHRIEAMPNFLLPPCAFPEDFTIAFEETL